jgi:hypothetical protein
MKAIKGTLPFNGKQVAMSMFVGVKGERPLYCLHCPAKSQKRTAATAKR